MERRHLSSATKVFILYTTWQPWTHLTHKPPFSLWTRHLAGRPETPLSRMPGFRLPRAGAATCQTTSRDGSGVSSVIVPLPGRFTGTYQPPSPRAAPAEDSARRKFTWSSPCPAFMKVPRLSSPGVINCRMKWRFKALWSELFAAMPIYMDYFGTGWYWLVFWKCNEDNASTLDEDSPGNGPLLCEERCKDNVLSQQAVACSLPLIYLLTYYNRYYPQINVLLPIKVNKTPSGRIL